MKMFDHYFMVYQPLTNSTHLCVDTKYYVEHMIFMFARSCTRMAPNECLSDESAVIILVHLTIIIGNYW